MWPDVYLPDVCAIIKDLRPACQRSLPVGRKNSAIQTLLLDSAALSRYNLHIARCPGRAGAAQRRVFLNLELDDTNLIACFWDAASDQADGMSFFFVTGLDTSNRRGKSVPSARQDDRGSSHERKGV